MGGTHKLEEEAAWEVQRKLEEEAAWAGSTSWRKRQHGRAAQVGGRGSMGRQHKLEEEAAWAGRTSWRKRQHGRDALFVP